MLRFLLFLSLARVFPAQAEDLAKSARVADMPAAHAIPVQTAFAYFEKHRSAPGMGDKLALTKIARDGLGLKALLILGSGPDPQELDALSVGMLARQVDRAVMNRKDWAEKVDAKARAEMERNREFLSRTFSDPLAGTHAWPWFLYQWGEGNEAKRILKERFEAESARVMALKQASYFGGQGPLVEAEFLHGALRALLSGEEKEKLDAELQKLKVHVSRLPQNQIMT